MKDSYSFIALFVTSPQRLINGSHLLIHSSLRDVSTKTKLEDSYFLSSRRLIRENTHSLLSVASLQNLSCLILEDIDSLFPLQTLSYLILEDIYSLIPLQTLSYLILEDTHSLTHSLHLYKI